MKNTSTFCSLMRLVARIAILGVVLSLAPVQIAEAVFLSGTGGAPPVIPLGTTLDFDSGPVGNFPAVTLGNVKFVGVDGNIRIDPAYIGQYNTLGVNSLQTGTEINPLLPSVWHILFTTPATAFAFNFGASDNTWQMDAYDSGNNLIATYFTTTTGGSNAGDYIGIAAPDIAKVVMTDQLDFWPSGDFIFIDDFTYTSEPLPEPSTWALAVMAAGGVVALVRRRRRRDIAMACCRSA